MPNPEFAAISSLETTIILSPETTHTQSHINLANDTTIELNNIGNMKRKDILITLTLNNASGNIVLTNQTTNTSITITKDPAYSSGTVFTMYYDAVYVNNSEVTAIYTAPFIIQENIINTLQISAGVGVTTNIQVQWTKQSNEQSVIAYVRNFSLNRNSTFYQQPINKLEKFSDGYIPQEILYDLSIGNLYFKNYFLIKDPNTVYHIIYKTNDAIFGIQQQTFYLCGVSMNSWGISHGESELILENLRGGVCKVLLG